MSSNEYLDNLVKELESQGITPPKNNVEQNDEYNKDLEIIKFMEEKTGVKYSDEQKKILMHRGNACILACAGSGKALVNSTKVLTHNGLVRIDELKIGDSVFDSNGDKQRVLGVFPQGKKVVYRIRFSNNTMIECCEDHLWTVLKDGSQQWEVRTTKDLMSDISYDKPTSDYKVPYIGFDTNMLRQSAYVFAIQRIMPGFSTVVKEILDTWQCNEFTYRDIIKNVICKLDNDEAKSCKSFEACIMYYFFEFIHSRLNGTIRIVSKNFIKVVKEVAPFYGLAVEVNKKDKTIKISCAKEIKIESITETSKKAKMTCISVSGDSELFMIENGVATHNTTISTHLIAKRILTGEILDVNKLIYTTFSKAGSVEMKERLDKVLNKLGIGNVNVDVKTLHSFFMSIISTFGLKKEVLSESERARMVKKACKEADLELRDDDLMIVNNLLSYQINNLLTNKKLVDSYVNTIENLTVDKYKAIVHSYKRQKEANNLMDFDDMQYFIWMWLVKWAKSDNQQEKESSDNVLRYCKQIYNDFYIDEAQDVSKIQYEIIKAIVTNEDDKTKLEKGLVFIGDDDQCLVEGTKVLRNNGSMISDTEVNIEDIKAGDIVKCAVGDSGAAYRKVDKVLCKKVERTVFYIETAKGYNIRGTGEHKALVRIDYDSIPYDADINFRKRRGVQNSEPVGDYCDSKYWDLTKHINVKGKMYGYYVERYFNELRVGDYIPVLSGYMSYNDTDMITMDKIVRIKTEQYHGNVYDLSIPEARNFIANGIVVHNCIYQWRGSDPSIILNIGATFNMKIFVLSTNYRCKNEIVDYATVGIKCNNSRFDKSMNAFEKGGNVKIYPSAKKDLCALSTVALNQIKYWIKQGDDINDIAVLSRNNFHLALLSNMLLREGIYCNISNDMKLTKSYMYHDVKKIIELSDTCWKSETTATILWRLCSYMSAINARAIAKFQDSLSLSLEDTLGWLLKTFVDKTIDFNKKLTVEIQAREHMEYEMSRMSNTTTNDLLYVYDILTKTDRKEKIKLLLGKYLLASAYLYKSDDKNRSINGLVQYINRLIEEDGVDKTLQFLRVTEQFEDSKMTTVGGKVTLSTIHSAKGREWKDVIMFACDNVSIPSFDGITKMIDDGISTSDISENIDEERRLFYVGNTRAKENLLVITYMEPSIFILESLGAFNDNKGNNSKIIEIAKDENWSNSYSDIIQDNIMSANSKYFYNVEDYK